LNFYLCAGRGMVVTLCRFVSKKCRWATVVRKNHTRIQDVVMTGFTTALCLHRNTMTLATMRAMNLIAGAGEACIFKLLPPPRKFSVNGLHSDSSKMRTGDVCLSLSRFENSAAGFLLALTFHKVFASSV
jgi:hypothetical protein